MIFFKHFLSDYNWWFGSKTIDRSDYFVSPVLNLANVVNVTQTYIADLANILSDKQELIDILVNDYQSYQIASSEKKSKTNIIYYGAPGTGKSHKVKELLNEIDSQYFERITFHPEFDHASFVGGYKPISKGEEIKYNFVPQSFTNIYTKAWSDLDNQYYLVIEEINRGNCAEIFGDLFQLLDRNNDYTVSPSTELKQHLVETFGSDSHEGIANGLKLPPNLSLLATMNTSDQSLFPMDSAFKRRWDWEYIPICYEAQTQDGKENTSFNYKVIFEEGKSFSWIEFIKVVNYKIKSNPNLGMDKCIGNYFIKAENSEITLKEFINKAIFYLWNDVFKDEDSSDSIFEKGVYYEDFFPVNSNGKNLIEKIIKTLEIEIHTTLQA